MFALLLALTACESKLTEGEATPREALDGSVSFALKLADGIEIEEVRYRITRDGGFESNGAISLLDEDNVFKALITLPSASAYSLELAADTVQGATCTGHARFDIWPDQKTAVNVLMRCPGMAELGTADLTGLFNVCPFIDTVLVQPDQVEVGETFGLMGEGHDQDSSGTLQYLWTATGGSLMNDKAATASLLCTAPGAISVRLTVSDGDLGCDVVSPVIEVTCNAHDPNDTTMTGTGGAASLGGTGGVIDIDGSDGGI
jgi:hypothetical protein